MSVDRSLTIAASSTPERRQKRSRSRVTNHRDLLPGINGRSAHARRFRDLVNAYVVDCGGLDRCSEIKISLIRRLAAVVVQAEILEARMINGKSVDVGKLCTLASTTVRLSQRIGIDRAARNIGPPSVDAYLSKRNGKSEFDIEFEAPQ